MQTTAHHSRQHQSTKNEICRLYTDKHIGFNNCLVIELIGAIYRFNLTT